MINAVSFLFITNSIANVKCWYRIVDISTCIYPPSCSLALCSLLSLSICASYSRLSAVIDFSCSSACRLWSSMIFKQLYQDGEISVKIVTNLLQFLIFSRLWIIIFTLLGECQIIFIIFLSIFVIWRLLNWLFFWTVSRKWDVVNFGQWNVGLVQI